jgi:TonB-linked SusC/RagA family outer membrane protein
MQVSASLYSQSTKLSLDLRNSRVVDVLEAIENQSEYRFAYSAEYIDMNRKVDVNVKSQSIEKTLAILFNGTDVKYKVNDRHIMLFLEGSGSEQFVSQQQKTITGKVTDSSGGPLPGAAVIIKGTINGTITDTDGNYTFSNVQNDAILQFSFVGMNKQEIAVGNKNEINVTMVENTIGIEEVVAIGYGTQKRSDVTGSVASVKGDQLSKLGTVNLSQSIQGQVPGVSVTNTSGKPGANASIIIRGQGSYGDSNPLYVVDGAIVSDIDFLNTNDVQSVEVLKDASSAAIYGSRAANGVVIVTTKRGKSGKQKITFTSNVGVQSIAKKLGMATSQQWKDKEVWKYENEGIPVPEKLQSANFDPSISTDWQDVLFRTAMQQNYGLDFSGGGENNNFLLSLGYVNQEGTEVGSYYERINIRANSDFIANKFKFGESLSVSSSKSNSVDATTMRGWPEPVFKPQDEKGNYHVIPDGYGLQLAQFLTDGNKLAFIEIPHIDNPGVSVIGNVYAQFEFFEGFYAKTSASVQWTYGRHKEFTPVYVVDYITNPIADFTETRSEASNYLWENTLNFSRVFGDHSVNAVAGWTRQLSQSHFIRLDAEGFPSGIYQANAATTILPTSTGSLTEDALESLLGRINYSYKNKYQITASVRRDGSSRLIKELREGVFPSFSLAWVASEEPFFPENSFIDRLKIRGGYGELGRLNAVGAYQVQNTLTFGGSNVDYILGSSQQLAQGVTLAAITNQNLLWERARSTNIALETNLFENRISFIAEYFIKNTKDLQFGAPLPMTVGANSTSLLVNAGDIENKGFEFTLGYHKTSGDFKYNIVGNLFAIKNKVLKFRNPGDVFIGGQYGLAGQNATRAEVGKELSNFWLLRTDGIFASWEEVKAHSKDGVLIQPLAQPGDLRFKDVNGDGRIDTNDKEFIDGSIPDFEYGLNFNGSYKNFDLSFVLQGVSGQKIFNGVVRALDNILKEPCTDFWREDNLDAKYFRPSQSDPNTNRGDNDFYLEDAGYLRLKNIQLGYTLPRSLLSKINVNTIRLSLTAQNLFTITKFSGYDPEVISFGLDRGVNTNVFPLSKTILFGLSVDF